MINKHISLSNIILLLVLGATTIISIFLFSTFSWLQGLVGAYSPEPTEPFQLLIAYTFPFLFLLPPVPFLLTAVARARNPDAPIIKNLFKYSFYTLGIAALLYLFLLIFTHILLFVSG